MRNIRTLINYIKPQKKLFFLDIFCATLISLIDLIYPYVSRLAMYNWLPENKFKTFFIVSGIILAAYIIRAGLFYIVSFYGHIMGISVESEMRKDLFTHVQDLSFSFFDNNRTGALMSRITSDLFQIVELAHHGPENLILSFLTIIGALIVLFTISWKLALILTIIIPFLCYFIYRIGKLDMDKNVEEKKTLGVVNSSIESTLSGIRTSKAFCNEKIERIKFDKSTKNYFNAKKEYYVIMAIFYMGTEFVYSILPLIVLAFGGLLIKRNEFNYIDLITFMLYINTFVTPLKKISNMAETFTTGFAGLERFQELMDIKPEINDPENPKELEISRGNIDFKNVNFSYSNNNEILHDLNLHINGGDTIAVVGSSGGGKTTLCQLLPRFYDVSSGSISIDGIDIRDVRQSDLRKHIGIVQQDVFLFADSIMENIRYGRPDASDDEVYEAAKRAELYDDVMAMPDGFSTYTGERGVMLSGGQKQRVAIARIFLKNPPILILDEATSALDSITESTIQKAFDDLSEGRTTLIIAHRLSTIKKAKTIIVVDNGNIAEKGSHKDLLELNGVYANLYNTQMGI